MKSAAPTVGSVESVTETESPGLVNGADAEQLLPPTVQFKVAAAQGGGGTTQVALVGAPHDPSTHENCAAPVVGSVESMSETSSPLGVCAADAEQVTPVTVQLNACAVQSGGGGTAQVAPAPGADQPLGVQVKVASPSVGPTESTRVVLAPAVSVFAGAEQVCPPTSHVSVWASHPGGGGGTTSHVPVSYTNDPAVQRKIAVPTSIGVESLTGPVTSPFAVVGANPLQLLPPTFQLTDRAAQSPPDGGGVGVGVAVGITSAQEMLVPPSITDMPVMACPGGQVIVVPGRC